MESAEGEKGQMMLGEGKRETGKNKMGAQRK
jgi:hypothetical protein